MKNTLLTKNTILAIIIGALSIALLRPILLTPYLFFSVLIPIPYMIHFIILVSFFCGGLVTGYIAIKSGWLYGFVAGLLVSGAILLSYWSQVKYSLSLHEISQY